MIGIKKVNNFYRGTLHIWLDQNSYDWLSSLQSYEHFYMVDLKTFCKKQKVTGLDPK